MKTMYEPLGHYSYADTDYVVFARRKKNGIVQFRTRRVHGFLKLKSQFIPHGIINVKEQWEKIINAGATE